MKDSLLNKFKKSPSFSFRGKFNHMTSFNNPQHLPSPNTYKPEKLIKNDSKVVFTKSKRKTFLDRKLQKSPGPGQYQTSRPIEIKHPSSQSQRKLQTFTGRFYQPQQQKPGPGAYDVKNDFKKTLPTFSMGIKYKTTQQFYLQKNQYKPSPGAYQLDKISIKSSSIISIPKSPRMTKFQTSAPGPGKYELNESQFSSQRSFNLKRTFTSSKRNINFQLKNQSPGPGNYIHETSFQSDKRRHKGFSCRSKILTGGFAQDKSHIPGPGKYQFSFKKYKFHSSQGFKMPKSQRKFNLGGKLQQNLNTQTSELGPGKYEHLNETYGKFQFKSLSVPKFSKAKLETLSSIKPKHQASNKFYDIKQNLIKRSSILFSISNSKKRSMFQTKSIKQPTPYSYNIQKCQKLIRQTILSSKFSQCERNSIILSKLKTGPGQYYNEQQQNDSRYFNKAKGTKFSKQKRIMMISQNQ